MENTTEKNVPTRALYVSRREFDTILAALRLWQRPPGPISQDYVDLATDNGDRLTDTEIDELIERIN